MESEESAQIIERGILTRPNICAIMVLTPNVKEGIIIADEQKKQQKRREIDAEIVRELMGMSDEERAELVRRAREIGLFANKEPRE